MKKRMIVLAGMLMLAAASLVALAADPGETTTTTNTNTVQRPLLSTQEVKDLLDGSEGDTATIFSITENQVVFENDLDFRLTDQTQYFSDSGEKLTRLNFSKGAKVRYFLDSPYNMGVMIAIHH